MAYQATIIPVMIASPGDVLTERGIVREVLHDWNDVNSTSSKVVLSPVGWDSHSSPELGASPQELINARLLKDCDLLVGIFWTRLGTPTENFPSGTVEEIKEHVQKGKPAMIYFSSSPVAPQMIDGKQFEQLKVFKDECKGLGLVQEYENSQEFKNKFFKQLQICILKNPYLQSVIKEISSIDIETVESTAYPEQEIKLSQEAIKLLKAASSDGSGSIINRRHMGGHTINSGGATFGGQYGRESALWEGAINELVDNDLILDRGYKGEIFELTHQGWSLADKLNLN